MRPIDGENLLGRPIIPHSRPRPPPDCTSATDRDAVSRLISEYRRDTLPGGRRERLAEYAVARSDWVGRYNQ